MTIDNLTSEIEEKLKELEEEYGDRMMDVFSQRFIKNRIKDPAKQYDLICKIEHEKLEQLGLMIDNLEIADEENTKEKGNKLEDIVEFIFSNLKIFDVVYTNKRNSTNEMDLVIQLDNEGKLASYERLFPFREIDSFIIECKNYNKKVDVTWVGKFYSLLRSCNLNFGIIFSIKGFTAKSKWQDAKGLSKKLLLKDNVYILDFNKKHLESIADGSNFIKLLEEEKRSLDLDVNMDFDRIENHDLESEISEIVANLL